MSGSNSKPDPDSQTLHWFPIGEEGLHVIDGTPCHCMGQTRCGGRIVYHNAFNPRLAIEIVRRGVKSAMRHREDMPDDDQRDIEHADGALGFLWPEQ